MADPTLDVQLIQAPVTYLPTDRVDEPPAPGIALCLSGGGYRAMLFHLGALWRINEAGLLPRLAQVSSVSGGSITAAVLALHWHNMAFDERQVATQFVPAVVEPIRRLAGRTIDVPAILLGCLVPTWISQRIVGAYRKHLFGSATLAHLPDYPPVRV